jgi:CHAT domain-containing protein
VAGFAGSAEARLMRSIRSSCDELRGIEVTRLPDTRDEVHWAAKQWDASLGEAALFTGKQASEDNFKAHARGKRVIHIATHGYFLKGDCNPEETDPAFRRGKEFKGENPLLLSGLFLAGANLHGKLADSLGCEDGILTAYEVSAMDLGGNDLVVLSACETGLGKVHDGEGVYGLRRAFQIAGSRTIVSALWPVSDRATKEMMRGLYTESGTPLYERIRSIQLARLAELRQSSAVEHPYDWAGFIALGDWR